MQPRSWKSYFAFETLPPPLRGPPPPTEGGEGCAVTLNVGRGLAPAVCGKSDFTFRKSQRLLRRSRCDARVLSVSLCCTTKTSSRALPSLRMTHSRGVCGGRMFARVHGVRPYGFEDKADCLYRLCSPHPPRAVPLPRWGRLGWCPPTRVRA